jgi:hypothetical protein
MLLGARIDIFSAQFEKVVPDCSKVFLVFSFQEWFSNSDAKKYKLNPMYWITSINNVCVIVNKVENVLVNTYIFDLIDNGVYVVYALNSSVPTLNLIILIIVNTKFFWECIKYHSVDKTRKKLSSGHVLGKV